MKCGWTEDPSEAWLTRIITGNTKVDQLLT
jgi:hypothetical protein